MTILMEEVHISNSYCTQQNDDEETYVHTGRTGFFYKSERILEECLMEKETWMFTTSLQRGVMQVLVILVTSLFILVDGEWGGS
jgi:hypothetical protein